MCPKTRWSFSTTTTSACRRTSGTTPTTSSPSVSCKMAASSSRTSSSPSEPAAARAWATRWRSWSVSQSSPIYWDRTQSHRFPGTPTSFRWARSQCRRSHMNFKSTFDIEILDLLPSLHPPFPHRKKKNIPYKSPHDWQNTRSSSITTTTRFVI